MTLLRPTPDEERDLVARAKAGDAAAADDLVRQVEPFVQLHATRLHAERPSVAADACDLRQLGLCAVARAIGPFDPALNFRWMTYAGTSAVREMTREAERLFARQSLFPADPEADPDHTPASEYDADADASLRAAALLAKLPRAQRLAVSYWYGIGQTRPLTVAQVAFRLGLSAAKCRTLLHAAMAALRGSGAGGDTMG